MSVKTCSVSASPHSRLPVLRRLAGLLFALVAKFSVLVFQLQNHGDAGEIQAGRKQVADAAKPIEIIGAVSPGAARGSSGFYEAARLVKAQILGWHPDQLGGDSDAVDGAGAMDVRPCRSFQNSSCPPLVALSRVLYKIYRAHHRSSTANSGRFRAQTPLGGTRCVLPETRTPHPPRHSRSKFGNRL